VEFLNDPTGWLFRFLSDWLTSLGMAPWLTTALLFLVGAFALATGAMVFTMLLIWLERKIIGRVQDRLGPNRVGPFGLFQSVADMLKIFTKEHITPFGADRVPFNLAPVLSVAAVLMVWAVIPFTLTLYGVDLNVAVLYIVAVGSLGEMAVVLAGWGSNNKFALLAAFRAVAQLISYEVPMVLSLLIPVMLAGSMSLNTITQAQQVPYILVAPVAALIFFISSIAEVGRAPFDLVESESELVAGFNIEYSGLKFGMFYVADFLHAFTISLLFATFFLGGWMGPGVQQFPLLGVVYYIAKTAIVYFAMIVLRASMPRFRIDQMMDLNWKILTPVSLILIIFTALMMKLVPQTPKVVFVAAMLVMNVLVLVIYDTIYDRLTAGSRRKQVATPRPVATPEKVSAFPVDTDNPQAGVETI